jgi:uncharacterized membrane protein
MAGIGFELRKLLLEPKNRTKWSTALGSLFSTAGTWILSVTFLITLQIAGPYRINAELHSSLMSILIYCFAFSLICSHPLTNMITRELSDLLYLNKKKRVHSLIVTGASLTGGISFLFFYMLLVTLSGRPDWLIPACQYFTSLSLLWYFLAFSSILKRQQLQVSAFAAGCILGILCMFILPPESTLTHRFFWLTGCNSAVLICLYSVLYKQYPGPLEFNIKWMQNKVLWCLLLSGLGLSLIPWIDKLLYWFYSDLAVLSPIGLQFFPAYDTAVFLGYFTIIPSIAYFTIFIETTFADCLNQFLASVESGNTLEAIHLRTKAVFHSIFSCLLKLSLFQLFCSIILTALMIFILDKYNIQLSLLPFLRIAVLNAGLQMVFQCCIIFLYYFDYQKEVLFVSLLTVIIAFILAWKLLPLRYEGVGLACTCSLIFGVITTLFILWYKSKRMLWYLLNQG